jgi:glucosamine--fructose-6-phosphate aminotransferase (isomerizing)
MSSPKEKPDFMLLEMLEQPNVLKSILNDKKIRDVSDYILESGANKIILTGSGDSYCAALFGEYLGKKWLTASFESKSFPPFEFVNFFEAEDLKQTCVIGLSVSGNSPRVIEAVRYANRKKATTIGITDNPNGKLARKANQTLFIHASPPESLETTSYVTNGAKGYVGYQHDIAQTKTYIGNLAVLSTLLASLSKSYENLTNVKKTFQMVSGAIEQRAAFLNLDEAVNNNIDKLFFVASGPNRSSALYGTFKMYEFTLNGYSCDIEEYCHTQYFITTDRSLVIFLVPDRASLIRVMEIVPVLQDEIQAKTGIFANSDFSVLNQQIIPIQLPGVTELTPLVFTIPIEFLSYSIAKAQGLDTNKFRGGLDTEKYVSGSFKTIRQSKIHF